MRLVQEVIKTYPFQRNQYIPFKGKPSVSKQNKTIMALHKILSKKDR